MIDGRSKVNLNSSDRLWRPSSDESLEQALVTGRLSAIAELTNELARCRCGYHRFTAPRTVTSCVFFEVAMVAAAPRRATVPATRALASTRRSVQPTMLRPEGDRGVWRGLARRKRHRCGLQNIPAPAPPSGPPIGSHCGRVWVYVKG